MVVGPGFAAGLFVAADIEDDRVGALRRLHRLRDPLPVLRGIGECHLVRPPIVVLGDLDALGIDDASTAADLVLDAVEPRPGVRRKPEHGRAASWDRSVYEV